MVKQGKLINIGHGKAFGLTEKMHLIHGRLQIQRSGIGFVIPEDKRRKDIFVSSDNLDDAWPEDKVVVALLPGRHGKNPEGRIVRILERKLKQVPALLHKKMGDQLYWGQPTNRKMNINFMVDTSNIAPKPQINEVVVVQPGEKLDTKLWSASAIETIGPEEKIEVQEKIVKITHDISREFPTSVLKEVQKMPDDPFEDASDRKDLSELPFVTIDAAKAKDFDDAICVKKQAKQFKLYVAIADVSHYISPGSALDKEAKNRANSYYFPQSVEPMFPPKLSNGLCSLNPQVKRLVMVVEMDFSFQGQILQANFYPGIIKSQARLTYKQIKKVLIENDHTEQEKLGNLFKMLLNAQTLAKTLYEQRKARGSLDFDLPEPEILFNIQDETIDIRPKVRHFGHQIIEEFMIAANEAVARFLNANNSPCMYRIHPEPDQDKLHSLFKLLHKTSIGANLPTDTDPKSLQQLLQYVENTELEFLVNRLLLRTMMQASYNPENQGHFGLASEYYCHFTSPIRRYADLLVHRSLKYSIGALPSLKLGYKKLKKLGEHLSIQERKGMEAEREIIKRITVLFLKDKAGQNFSGVISSLADFGFWVELVEVMAEGLVRLSTLTDDYYVLWPEAQKIIGQQTGKIFYLGQKVKVKLMDVSLSKQEINLEIKKSFTQ